MDEDEYLYIIIGIDCLQIAGVGILIHRPQLGRPCLFLGELWNRWASRYAALLAMLPTRQGPRGAAIAFPATTGHERDY